MLVCVQQSSTQRSLPNDIRVYALIETTPYYLLVIIAMRVLATAVLGNRLSRVDLRFMPSRSPADDNNLWLALVSLLSASEIEDVI